jgi:hypothetical protein
MDKTVTVEQEIISGHELQMRLHTKTDLLTDLSECDFDVGCPVIEGRHL